MTWIISYALASSLSLLEQAEESSALTSSASEQSAPSNGTLTPLAFCAPDRMREFSRLSRFGVTFKPSTVCLGADWLTSFLAGFPARTSAPPVRAQASTESDRVCGRTWLASLAKYDPDLRSWRTPQRSLLEGLDVYSETWPSSGMMRSGVCWARPTLELRTSAIVSGSLLPTPCTVDSGALFNRSKSPNAKLRPTLGAMAKFDLWPTPTVNGNYNSAGSSAKSGDGLATMARKYPTPVVHDHKVGANGRGLGAMFHPQRTGGQLNPTWVEWLMGWPLGWTVLGALETDKFQQWQQQHSSCLRGVLR